MIFRLIEGHLLPRIVTEKRMPDIARGERTAVTTKTIEFLILLDA